MEDLPNIWSFFYPLYDRSMFTEGQMSFVDGNYILLSNLQGENVAVE